MGVGKYLFPIFALALDLPVDFFDDKVSYILTFSDHPTPSPTKPLPWIAKTLRADKLTPSFIMALLDQELGRGHESSPLPSSDRSG